MGIEVLRDLIKGWSSCELDDSIYIEAGTEPKLESPVKIVAFDPKRSGPIAGYKYLLSMEQVRDVIEGLEVQLGRTASDVECLRALVHYSRYDAFIDPRDAMAPEPDRS